MASLNDVTKLYVATFNRAPDSAGLDYWVYSSGLTLEQIAQSFFDQSETQSAYPAGTSNSTFVNTIYNNLFNRDAEPAGLQYWVGELDAGRVSRDTAILAFIGGALGDDATILTNKQTVGLSFYNNNLNDTTLARSVMSGIDATTASVTSALNMISQNSGNGNATDISLVSITADGTIGDSSSLSSSISSDGRYITFESYATNLINGDTNAKEDIFLKDTQTGTVSLISSSSSGTIGNDASVSPVISADGRYVVFESYSSNLISGAGGISDVFLKDTQTGITTLISQSIYGYGGNDDSYNTAISSDGRYVVFRSDASNLVNGDTNGYGDIFLRDTQTGITSLVSSSSSSEIGNRASWYPDISADGNFVVFESASSNIVAGDVPQIFDGIELWFSDIFLKNTITGAATLISSNSSGAFGNSDSFNASISSNGRYVVFDSTATNLVSGDTNSQSDIFLKDTQTGITTLISCTAAGEQGNNGSYSPSISADGRFVVFYTSATNFVSGDTNDNGDVFLKDTQTGALELISKSSSGEIGNNRSIYPFISADGSYITFSSEASNLVSNDTNGSFDVFIVGNPLYVDTLV
ncbi:hypothetical protein Sulku_1776 [Sulfuricurvum kujiense DSM 16994]|uniref:DUF4214 domain-containing protein n=1 Tax=Sulfuricurvum kujiense (strain ATCC BAA-921 / DSM 16994 / JCM 11577 / YK-1) TaxID=709032 RepID=E4U1A0_SULKY|nr:DUF4214 domain-containing protein [Sulfuricurvum kujiense]ADR34437.1 hypothetical protein Sulku_1776 [Sulfuricurvum kujiense DSM 16994]